MIPVIVRRIEELHFGLHYIITLLGEKVRKCLFDILTVANLYLYTFGLILQLLLLVDGLSYFFAQVFFSEDCRPLFQGVRNAINRHVAFPHLLDEGIDFILRESNLLKRCSENTLHLREPFSQLIDALLDIGISYLCSGRDQLGKYLKLLIIQTCKAQGKVFLSGLYKLVKNAVELIERILSFGLNVFY